MKHRLRGFEFVFLFLSVIGGTSTRAAELTVHAERVFPKVKLEDRTESFFISRNSTMRSRSKQLILPISILVQNADTSVRNFDTELLDHRFLVGTTTLGRFGNVEHLSLLNTYQLFVQTYNTLSRYDLTSQEQVWKIPLPQTSGGIPRVLQSPEGYLYMPDAPKNNIRKIEAYTGETLAVITPERPFGLLATLGAGKLLLADGGRFSIINEKGQIQQQFGQVFPMKMYPAAHTDSDGTLVVTEYISSEHPNESLKRKNWVTVLNQDGVEQWNRVGFHWLLGTGKSTVYLEERTGGPSNVLALDKRTGNLLWRLPMSSDATFSATLREVEGRTFITNHDTLLVVSAESGAKIAERRWAGQTNLVVHGVYANEIVVSHRLEKSPHTTTVQTLRLN